MNPIAITATTEQPGGWQFTVQLGRDPDTTTHTVTLNRSDWSRLTNETIEPKDLVTSSFEFLLEREPKESILTSFNLTDIQKYFPDYEKLIADSAR